MFMCAVCVKGACFVARALGAFPERVNRQIDLLKLSVSV